MYKGSYLVTGASGFLGRHIVRELVAGGGRVSILCREKPARARSVDVILGDLLKPDLSLAGTSWNAVFHAAGLAHVVPRTPAEAKQFLDVNVDGTRNLLRALQRADRLPESFVLVSTVAVYGREAGIDLDESEPRKAEDPYGVSKRRAEDTVLEWGARCGVRVGIVRLPLVAGKDAPGNLGRMIRAIERRRYLGIGDGGARRSMVLARDVAAALPEIARRGGTYHLTDGHHPSFAELETGLSRIMAVPMPRRLPLWFARGAAALCDAARQAPAVRTPFSSATLRKMTSTLTFSDRRARTELGWRAASVVDHLTELV